MPADVELARREGVELVRTGTWSAASGNWQPTREDVENLTDYARGAIDAAEYDRRSAAAAHRAAEASRRAAGIVGAA